MANEYKKNLFISEKTLKEASVLNDNVDAKLIRPIITLAQDMHILPILGTKLFEGLQLRIDESSLTADDIILIEEYIEKTLVQATMYEMVDTTLYKFMNKTLGKTTDERVDSVTLDEATYIKNTYRARMNFYRDRLDAFLCHNTVKYPEYNDSVYPDVLPSGQPFKTSIYLGPRRDRGRGWYVGK
jgi:hypothetical protein